MVKGKVRFCDEESCSIEKRRVPIADIARITLVPGKLIPSAARMGGVVLTDGTMLPGAFTGLTLGYVEVGGQEIDRENVAEIILVKMEPAADTLIGTDGQSREGKLTACNAASCTFDGQTVPFGKIRWLGPGQENNVPPPATDANLVFVGEESPKEARLSGLDGTTVRTTRGSFARVDVKWIRLATPSAPPPGNSPSRFGAPQDPPPPPPTPAGGTPPGPAAPGTPPSPGQPPPTTDTPPPAGQTPPGPPSPRQPRPGATPPTGYPGDQPIRNGRIWLGRIEGRVWDEREDHQEDLRISVDVRLREDILRPIESDPPALKRVGDNIIFSEEGTVVRNTYRSSNSSETCRGGGETVLPAHPGLFTTTFYRRTRPGPMNSYFPFGLTIGKDPYVLAITPTKPTAATYEITCLDSNGKTHTRESSFTVPPAGRLYANSNSTDPEIRFLQGGRMIGSYERQPWATFEFVSLSWSVCVEGTACPPLDPPSTPENNEPLPPRDLPPEDDWCAKVTSLIAKLRADRTRTTVTRPQSPTRRRGSISLSKRSGAGMARCESISLRG